MGLLRDFCMLGLGFFVAQDARAAVVNRRLKSLKDNQVQINNAEMTAAGPQDASNGQSGVVIKERIQVKRPPLYGVYLLNDDYTPMEFVIGILEKHFNKDHMAATEIMLKVHKEGRALCGMFPYEIAETKVTLVIEEARQNGHPLQCVMERA